jgi:hypothetical protein
VANDRGSLMDPKSWGEAVRDVGPSYGVIFALIALLGYLSVRGVPAIMMLTSAIQNNTDSVAQIAHGEEQNQTAIVANQSKIIDNESEIIQQHMEMNELIKQQSIEIDQLIADDKARAAHDILHGAR